jgi:hypothetical protein
MENQTDQIAVGTQGAEDARVDLAALPQDGRADPALKGVGETQAAAEISQDSYPSFHDDDLPAPSFIDTDLPTPAFHEDDLPAPAFHDDDLPAPSVHSDDFPADLTNFGLGRLLGLELSSTALPTVGEVVRTNSQSVEPAEPEPEDDEQSKEEAEEPDTADDDVSPDFTAADDLSFIDPQSLTDRAATNNATSQVKSEFDDELFELGLSSPKEVLGLNNLFPTSAGGAVFPAEESGGGGGGGTNVINGSAGDDILNGTAGNDLIHG